MIKIILIIFAALFVGFRPALGASSTDNYTLTLENAKRIAVERNADLAAARASLEAAKARETRAASGFYPKINAKFGMEQQPTGSDSQDGNSAFGYLSAQWNLYRGGLDVARAKTETLSSERIRLGYETKKFQVENEVERVFYRMLFLRDVEGIKNTFIEINGQQQALARQMVARGGASQSDVTEFDLRTSDLKSDLVGIEQEYAGNQTKLKVLLGEDIAKNPQPTGELPHQHLEKTLTDYANASLKDAPDIKTAALSFDIASHKATAAKGRFLPQVDLEASFGALPPSDGGTKDELGSRIAVVATWEIFGGFDASSEVKEALAEKSAFDAELQGTITGILAEIETSFSELLASQKRSDILKDNIALAKKYYDLIFQDFKRGYKNSGDFSSAAKAWYDAEVRQKELDMEFVEKKLVLENKIGRKISANKIEDVRKSPANNK